MINPERGWLVLTAKRAKKFGMIASPTKAPAAKRSNNGVRRTTLTFITSDTGSAVESTVPGTIGEEGEVTSLRI